LLIRPSRLSHSHRQIKEDKQHFEHYYTDMLFFFDIIIVKW